MKNVRKIAAWLCAGILALSLTACGKTPASDTPTPMSETDVTRGTRVSVNFTIDNLVSNDTSEYTDAYRLTYKAGSSTVTFLTKNVQVNDDGSLTLLYGAELFTESGVTNIVSVDVASDADLDHPFSVEGLFSMDGSEEKYGCDYENIGLDFSNEGIVTTTFGHGVQKTNLTYYFEDKTCTLTSMDFYTADRAEAVPSNLTETYVSFFEHISDDTPYGKAYTVSWDFADASIVVDSATENGYLTSLTLYNPATGENERFACKNCTLQDGKLTIGQNGYMILMSEMGGMGFITPGLDMSKENFGSVFAGYCLLGKSELDTIDEILWSCGGDFSNDTELGWFNGLPNFFRIRPAEDCTVTLTSLTISYDNVATGMRSAFLDTDFYGYYLEGSYYDATRERFDEAENIFDFYLTIVPDSPYYNTDYCTEKEMAENAFGGLIWCIPDEMYSIGDLKSADGAYKSKDQPLAAGDTLEVTVGTCSFDVALPVYPAYAASSLKELMPSGFTDAVGQVNVLVVPLYFEDQKNSATAENTEKIYEYLGRVLQSDGSVQDYSDEDVSFSAYFDLASYGQLTLNSFVTDWYCLPDTYENSGTAPIADFVSDIDAWVNTTYKDMLSSLDQDGDGLYDAVIFLCAAPDEAEDTTDTISFQGSYNTITDYGHALNITDGTGAGINHYSTVNLSHFTENGNVTTGTLCHEFSHQIGLIDYYDVDYTGINAVGTYYDMQSDNFGDWNSYSKFAAGWISPQVVAESDIDAGVTLTINAYEKDGSAIVIPTADTEVNADGTISPFSEYLILDLFTAEGLYGSVDPEYPETGETGLVGPGVRIYHVDSRRMAIDGIDLAGEPYTVGVEVYTNVSSETGRYQVELIQAGGVNTFTDLSSEDLDPVIRENDLFHAGDTFSIATHGSFFYEGCMDDGSAIDFTITVLSIEDGTATIRIEK